MVLERHQRCHIRSNNGRNCCSETTAKRQLTDSETTAKRQRIRHKLPWTHFRPFALNHSIQSPAKFDKTLKQPQSSWCRATQNSGHSRDLENEMSGMNTSRRIPKDSLVTRVRTVPKLGRQAKCLLPLPLSCLSLASSSSRP